MEFQIGNLRFEKESGTVPPRLLLRFSSGKHAMRAAFSVSDREVPHDWIVVIGNPIQNDSAPGAAVEEND